MADMFPGEQDRLAEKEGNSGKERKSRPPAAKAGPPPPEEYGRLQLLAPIKLANGGESQEVVIYRPTCRVMTEALDTTRLHVQIERFVEGCCRGVNGTGEAYPFSGGELSSPDGSELASVINAMSQDADDVVLDIAGDGVTIPIIYTLQRPIELTPGKLETEKVEQFEFMARKIGEISEYLDARGETREFHTFMRTFGKPLGIRIPIMTDILINSLDFLDYLVIRRQIMGKFISSRNRWKKASSLAPSTTIGRPDRGID